MSIRDIPLHRFLHKVATSHKNKELGFINQQRQTIVLVYAIAITLSTVFNIVRFSLSADLFLTISNILMLAVFLAASTGYTANKLSIVHIAVIMAVSVQLIVSTENIYCALNHTSADHRMIIATNMLILIGNTIITLATYLVRTTQITTAMATISYAICTFIIDDPVMKDSLVLVFIIFAFISFLGFRVTLTARRLQEENQTLRRDEEELMRTLRMNKEQIKAYIKLADSKHSTEETAALLEILGETSQMRLIENVSSFIAYRETDEARIEKTFPDFTPSEVRICQLILRDKKLREICAILDKTESNISTQRANIRKKLSLAPSDNLRKALIQRMK